MTQQEIAERVVSGMLAKDAFSKWLGVNLIELAPGSCTVRMVVREEMVNGFLVSHGGITYSLADSALAFASNSHGRIALSIETSISHTKKVQVGDTLTASATEESFGNSIAFYKVDVTNQDSEKVALFKGTVFRTKDNHPGV